ncbi:site-specific integrase [Vibrio navarrensis]|nr:site-specific integrase [Vibrio navarrensis]HDY8121360.1 site-specific integrase [Vibrio vulnificus]
MRKARSLTPSQIKKVLKKCLLMQEPELKRAALVLSLSTLRVSELAQITISDLLLPTGEIKTELHLRAALCERRRPRTVWLSQQTKLILQEWLDCRKRRKWAVTFDSDYQGLNPKSKVLLNNRGGSFSMKSKTRYNQSNERVDYFACDVLESSLRNIYQRCGFYGASSHTGRRSYATNMNAAGVPLETIQRALGHKNPSMSLEYIDISPDQLSKAAVQAF